MGEKFIIELEDEVNGLRKAKGFNTLVFDQNGVNKLTPFKEKEEESTRRWKPENNKMYWFIVDSGAILGAVWFDNESDCARFAIGNCFRTREDAEFAVERLKVIAELKEYAEPEDMPWGCSTTHYIIIYENENQKIETGISQFFKYSGLTFASKIDALAAVKAVGEERVKKYYLGIK